MEKIASRDSLRFWLGVILSMVLTAGAQLYGYGRLSERVDEMQYQVRELRGLLLLEHQQRASSLRGEQ